MPTTNIWSQVAGIAQLAGLVGCCLALSACSQSASIEPFAEDRVEMRSVIDGTEFILANDGNAYRSIDSGRRWVLHQHVYDPDEIRRAYVTENDQVYRVSPDTGEKFATIRNFSESFEDLGEGAEGLRNLVSPRRLRWGSFTLQTPQTPTVQDYVGLRARLLEGQSGFLDAIVEPSKEQAHLGQSSLKCQSPPKPQSMITCKASLSSPLVYFRSGDHVWFEAYYFVADAIPLTLMDLVCEFAEQHPGIRLYLFESGHLGAELKALDKPKYRPVSESTPTFPTNRWVQVRAHFELSANDGQVEIWQDGIKVVDGRGATLPFSTAIYNSLEIGISAHSFGSQASTLYVDDVRIADASWQ